MTISTLTILLLAVSQILQLVLIISTNIRLNKMEDTLNKKAIEKGNE